MRHRNDARLTARVNPTILGAMLRIARIDSAGAIGACRVYVSSPETFRGLVCLAAYPAPDALTRFGRTMDVRYICGGRESYVADGSFQRQMLSIKPKVRSLDWKIIDGAGHFFVLARAADQGGAGLVGAPLTFLWPFKA